MQFYWRENRLQIEPANQKERDALLLLAEERGLRKTYVEQSGMPTLPPQPLEIEIEGPVEYADCPHCSTRHTHQHWIGRLPAIPGVECSGVSASDAFNGVIIQAFQRMAELVQHGKELPRVATAWFTTVRPN